MNGVVRWSLLLMLTLGVSHMALGDVKVGVDEWAYTFPEGREVRAEANYRLWGKFVPRKNSRLYRWFPWLDESAKDIRLLIAGEELYDLVSMHMDVRKNRQRLYWMVRYVDSRGFTCNVSATAPDGSWVMDVDPSLVEASRKKKERDGGFLAWWSRYIIGELKDARERRIRERLGEENELYRKFGIPTIREEDGKVAVLDLRDRKVLENLKQEGLLSPQQVEYLDNLDGAINLFHDEFMNRVLGLTTRSPRVLGPDGTRNLIAELYADLYDYPSGTLDEMQKAKCESSRYTREMAEKWRKKLEGRAERGAYCADTCASLKARFPESGKSALYERLLHDSHFWYTEEFIDELEETDNEAHVFYAVHQRLDPCIPIWGILENGHPEPPGARLKDECWRLDASLLNGILHRDWNQYRLEGSIWVRRVTDYSEDDVSVPLEIKDMVAEADTPMLEREPEETEPKRCFVLRFVDEYKGKRSDLRLVPKDNLNKNLQEFAFDSDALRPSYVLVELDSLLPVYITLSLKAEIVGEDSEVSVPSLADVKLTDGSEVKLVIENRVTSCTDNESDNSLYGVE